MNESGTSRRRAPRKRRQRALPDAAARAVELLEDRRLLSATEPYISEFMALNTTGITDNFGVRSDWIEIHNPGPTAVNLQGWRLTENRSNLAMWTFPSHTLAAGGRLLVWASERNIATSGQTFHTNFTLSSSPDYLGLVRPNGTIASEYAPEYPTQVANISYGVMPPTTDDFALVDEVASARYFVPPDAQAGLGTSWTQTSFVDSSWSASATPLGYDSDPTGVDFGGVIETHIGAQMAGRNSVYVRVPFEVSDPGAFSILTLRMRADDGFIAYLNGVQIASSRAPAGPDGNSSATSAIPDAQALEYQDFNVTANLSALQTGVNVLAIHGLNHATDTQDMLLAPELLAVGSNAGLQPRQYFTTPTPGSANVSGALGEVDDTTFSADRGFYTAPFQLTIATDTSGAEIRYTTDGTDPTATTGLIYSGPITVDQTMTVKAAAYKAGFVPTDVDAQTYIFIEQVLAQNGANVPPFVTWGSPPDWAMDVSATANQTIRNDLKSIPTVSLSMPWNDWFGGPATGAPSNGIYITGSGIPKAVSMELIYPDGSKGVQINASVQVAGGASTTRWQSDKLSLRVKFKEPYGESKLDHDIFGNPAVDEFQNIILDAGYNHSFTHGSQHSTTKLIQDQVVADLQRKMSGEFSAVHGKWAHLYINGLYWGIYGIHERPDEHFQASYQGGDSEDYDVIKHTQGEVVNGTTATYQQLLSLARADLSIQANLDALAAKLDFKHLADYMIVNFYAGNTDWPSHNWYASFNKNQPGAKWHFHTWDAEHTFNGASVDQTGANFNGSPAEIHQRLSANAEYRQLFADRVHKHMVAPDGALRPTNAAATYQARVTEITQAIVAETARWGDNRVTTDYTQASWLATQQGLFNTYFPNRSTTVLNQLRNRSPSMYPTVAAPTFSQQGGTFSSPTNVTLTNPGAGTIYYTLNGSDPRLTGGGLSPSAIQYSGGSVNIPTTSVLQARVLNGATWSALNEATFIVGSAPPLRVSEIMYNPAPPPPGSPFTKDDFEFLELYNAGATTLDLSGYTISDGVTFTFPAGATLAAGARAVLVQNVSAFQSRYGGGVPILGTYGEQLGDASEHLLITTNLGQVVADFTYSDQWYPMTDGGGYSLLLRDPEAPGNLNLASSWAGGNDKDGRPTLIDFAAHDAGAVVINEVLANPQGGGVDFIELHNTTGSTIDIGRWFLTDSETNLTQWQIPLGTTIPAGGYVTFTQTQFGFGLSRSGEQVLLSSVDVAGNVGGYRQEQEFGGSANGVSFGRYATSTGVDFPALLTQTPGAPNSGPRIGPVVINEIMYNPAGTNPEFIELRNITGAEVPLYDPAIPANGWRFIEGITYTFASPASIPANGYALVVPIDPATFRTQYGIPAAVPIFGPYTAVLDNGGEPVTLARPDAPDGAIVPYVVVDSIVYDDVAPWPASADGAGPSIARSNSSAYGNDVINWAAEITGGSPGVTNFIPGVASVTINDGEAQRSMITKIVVAFDRTVSFGSDPFSVIGRDGAGTGTSANWTNPSGDGRTWVLGFSGAGVIGGSLEDGVYDLTINAASVQAGAFSLAANHAIEFHRLYSDADGDGDSDNADLFQMRATYGKFVGDPAYRAFFDYENDGDVDNADVFQVRSRRTKVFQNY